MKNCKNLVLLAFLLLFLNQMIFAQIYNGSFEINGEPSLDGWTIYPYEGLAELYQDSPFPSDSNAWCLQIQSGDYDGVFSCVAYQLIPEVQNGDIWKTSVWVRLDLAKTDAFLYWIKINEGFQLNVPDSLCSTSSQNWTKICRIDTITGIEEGDSIAIVLDAGIVIPSPQTDWAYFDLVSLEKIGNINSIIENSNYISSIILYQNNPNPFSSETSIYYQLPKNIKNARLNIFNTNGQLIKYFLCKSENNTIIWNGTDINNNFVRQGIYFYQLVHNNIFYDTNKMIFLK